MSRIVVEGHRWFDDDAAESWLEDTSWDGRNHISCATGSQWAHERLYRTPKGARVLYHWSGYVDGSEWYRFLQSSEAALWLLANDKDAVAEKYLADELEKLEA